MYRINGNCVETAPQESENVSGFPLYLAALPAAERQARGWYANLAFGDVAAPAADAGSDTIVDPRPVVPVPAVLPLSKRAILQAVEAVGKVPEFRAWLAASPVLEYDWQMMGETVPYDPAAHGGALASLLAALNVTEEQAARLIAQCRA